MRVMAAVFGLSRALDPGGKLLGLMVVAMEGTPSGGICASRWMYVWAANSPKVFQSIHKTWCRGRTVTEGYFRDTAL